MTQSPDPRSSVEELWQKEYDASGMPSSFRLEPSGSVVDFIAFLNKKFVMTGLALDIGFGRGRNSLYLASLGFNVTGFEIVPSLVSGLVQKSGCLGLSEYVDPIQQSVTELWSVPGSSFDVAIDTFCYKHQIEKAGRETYRRELARALRPGAYYLLTLADIGDGYYGPLAVDDAQMTGDERVIVDPVVSVPSVLYTAERIVDDFSAGFDLMHHELKVKDGVMHGTVYMRKTHVFYFRRSG